MSQNQTRIPEPREGQAQYDPKEALETRHRIDYPGLKQNDRGQHCSDGF